MKTIREVIDLWLNWRPTVAFPCPSSISYYYWDIYRLNKRNKPLFPEGEVNDVASVIVKSKPAAMISFCFDDKINKFHLEKITKIALQENICYSQFSNNKILYYIFSNNNTNKLIEASVVEHNGSKLGILLGYPKDSIVLHFQKVQEELKKYGGKEHISEFDLDYIKKRYPIAPQFSIYQDWFE